MKNNVAGAAQAVLLDPQAYIALAALLIPAALDIILSTLEFAVFTLDAWSDVEELVASINDKDPAWCVTISDTCQPLLEAEQVATASTRCTDGIRCPNALIGIVLIPTAVIIVLVLLFIFSRWKKRNPEGYEWLRKFMRLDDLDSFMTTVENAITYPCRSDGMWKNGCLKNNNKVAPNSSSSS